MLFFKDQSSLLPFTKEKDELNSKIEQSMSDIKVYS